MASALDSSNVFPKSYMELVIPSLNLASVGNSPGLNAGDEVPCGMSITFTQVAGLSNPPRCVAFN